MSVQTSEARPSALADCFRDTAAVPSSSPVLGKRHVLFFFLSRSLCVGVRMPVGQSLVPPSPVGMCLKPRPCHPDLRTHRREHVPASRPLCILGSFPTVSLFCVSFLSSWSG